MQEAYDFHLLTWLKPRYFNSFFRLMMLYFLLFLPTDDDDYVLISKRHISSFLPYFAVTFLPAVSRQETFRFHFNVSRPSPLSSKPRYERDAHSMTKIRHWVVATAWPLAITAACSFDYLFIYYAASRAPLFLISPGTILACMPHQFFLLANALIFASWFMLATPALYKWRPLPSVPLPLVFICFGRFCKLKVNRVYWCLH